MHRIPLGWQEATGKSRAAENIAECQGGPHHSLFPQTLPAWPELPVGAVVPAERRVLGRPRGAACGDSCTSVGSQYQSRHAPLPSGPRLVPLCPGAGAPPSYSAGPQNLGPILNVARWVAYGLCSTQGPKSAYLPPTTQSQQIATQQSVTDCSDSSGKQMKPLCLPSAPKFQLATKTTGLRTSDLDSNPYLMVWPQVS